MSGQFNLTNLNSLYANAWAVSDPTIIFEVNYNKGCFVFMMFLSSEEPEKNDKMYIYFRNINHLETVKLYGSHSSGDFIIYINKTLKDLIHRELQITSGTTPFDYDTFFNYLNLHIPQGMQSVSKSALLQNVYPIIKQRLPDLTDDADKTILIGIRRLPVGHQPRDKTLRKLYLHVNGVTNSLAGFIQTLKGRNLTLSWTANINSTPKSFAQLLIDLNNHP